MTCPRLSTGLLGALLLLGACATQLDPLAGTLASPRPDNSRGDQAALQARLAKTSPSPPAPSSTGPIIALVTAGATPHLQVRTLPSGEQLWATSWAPALRPVIVQDLVLTQRGDDLVALERNSGRIRFTYPLPSPVIQQIIGDATGLYIVTQSPDQSRTQLTALDPKNGDVRYHHVVPRSLGAATLANGLLLVPHGGQTLVWLDAITGTLLGRLRSTDDLITWADFQAGTLRFGDRRIYTFEPTYNGTSHSLPSIEPALARLPGSPPPRPARGLTAPADASAYGRVAAQASVDDPDWRTPYGIFYRHLLRLGPDGNLQWAKRLTTDIVTSQPTTQGLIVVQDSGHIALLDEQSGTSTPIATLPVAIASAQLADLADLVELFGGDATKPAPETQEAANADLREILLDPDTRLGPSRLLALQTLQQRQFPALTQDLLDLIAEPRTPPQLRAAATQALHALPTAQTAMVAAIALPHDRTAPQASQPIAVLAEALATQGVSAAVKPLKARLFDYQTKAEDLPAIARALSKLDAKAAYTAIGDFLQRYRADSSMAPYPDIMANLAQLMLELDKNRASTDLTQLANRRHTLRPCAAALQALLPAEAPSPASIDLAQAATASQQADTNNTSQQAWPKGLRPWTNIRATFEAHNRDLLNCAKSSAAAPPFKRIRIALVIAGNGHTMHRYYHPSDPAVSRCLDATLDSIQFSKSRTARQVAVYTVQLPPPETPSRPATPPPEWWTAYRDLAQAASPGSQTGTRLPWWQDKHPLLPKAPATYTSTTEPTEAEEGNQVRTVSPQPPTRSRREEPGPDKSGTTSPSTDAWWLPE